MKTLYLLTLNFNTRVGHFVAQYQYGNEVDVLEELRTFSDVIGAQVAQIELDDEGIVVGAATKMLYAYKTAIEAEWKSSDFIDLDIFKEQASGADTIYWAMVGQYLHPGVDQREEKVYYEAVAHRWWVDEAAYSDPYKGRWAAILDGLLMAIFSGGAWIEIRREVVREKIA